MYIIQLITQIYDFNLDLVKIRVKLNVKKIKAYLKLYML